MSLPSGYELSRAFWDFAFENPDRISPNHCALFFFAIEHCNRLGWKDKFGLPTTMAKEAIGIRSYNTYIKTLNDLIDFGFVTMIEKSKNQFSSNIIALSNFNNAPNKALDKALIKHTTKQGESTEQSNDSIDKPITINQEQGNKETSPFEEKLKLETEKQNLAFEIWEYFKVTQISNSNLWMKIHDFVEIIFNRNLFEHLSKQQWFYYKLYHEIEENKKFKHSPINFMGNLPDKSDGAWNSRDWEEAYNNSKNGTKKNFSNNDTGREKNYNGSTFVIPTS